MQFGSTGSERNRKLSRSLESQSLGRPVALLIRSHSSAPQKSGKTSPSQIFCINFAFQILHCNIIYLGYRVFWCPLKFWECLTPLTLVPAEADGSSRIDAAPPPNQWILSFGAERYWIY